MPFKIAIACGSLGICLVYLKDTMVAEALARAMVLECCDS